MRITSMPTSWQRIASLRIQAEFATIVSIASETDRTMRNEKSTLLFGLLCSALAGIGVFYCARRWAAAFEPFGGDLPPTATLALAIAPWLPLLLPLAVFIGWRLSGPERRRTVAVGGGLASMLVVLPTALAAMYLPLFKLAAAL